MPAKSPLYPDYLPVRPEGFTATLEVPLQDIPEPGNRADPELPEIKTAKAQLKNITPRIGTEIRGVQLNQLSKDGLDQVALLAAQRGVLVFVSSYFINKGRKNQNLTIFIQERARVCRYWYRQAERDRCPLWTPPQGMALSNLDPPAALRCNTSIPLWDILRALDLSSTLYMQTRRCKYINSLQQCHSAHHCSLMY